MEGLSLRDCSSLVCGIMRIVSSVQSAKDTNQTVALMKVALWAYGEIAAGLITSCMPIMPQFFRSVFPRAFQHVSEETFFTNGGAHKPSTQTREAWRANMLQSFARKKQQRGMNETNFTNDSSTMLGDMADPEHKARRSEDDFSRTSESTHAGHEEAGITVNTHIHVESTPRNTSKS